MIGALRDLVACTRAAAAVEAAFVAPLFLMLTVGITDLGSAMYEQMAVNAAAQAGAAYAVMHDQPGDTCETLTSTCLTNIEMAMNDASGGLSVSASPAPTIAGCADGSPTCVIVTASYQCTAANHCLILPDAAYSWAMSLNLSSTATIRIL